MRIERHVINGIALIENAMVPLSNIEIPLINDWHGMSEKELATVIQSAKAIRSKATVLGHDGYPYKSSYDRRTHEVIMENTFSKLWTYGDFRQIFPPTTSFNLLKALISIHDISRYYYRGDVSLSQIERVREKSIDKIYPNAPIEYLHEIGWLTGEVIPPSPETSPVAYSFKAIDTLSKPDVDPETFFEEGGTYDQWIKRQVNEGKIPFSVPLTHGHSIWVSPKQYKERDIEYTRTGLKIIEFATGLKAQDLFKP